MLNRFHRYLGNPRTVIWLLAGYFGAAILQGLAFVTMIPFLRAFLGGDPASALPALWRLLALAIGAFVIQWITLFASQRVSVMDICGTLVHRVGKQVSRLPLGWFGAGTSGGIAAVISAHTDTLSHLASIVFPNLIGAVVVPLTVLVAMPFYDWRLALVLACSLPLTFGVWRWGLRTMKAEHLQEPRLAAASAARLIEYAQLQPVLRARGLAGLNWAPLKTTLAEEYAAIDRLLRTQGPPVTAALAVSHLVFGGTLAAGLWLCLNESLDVATFVAIVLLSARFATPIAQALLYQAEVQKSNIALDAVGAVLDAPVLPPGSGDRLPDGHDIVFDKVGFGYEAGQPILQDLTLTAPQGQVTALVGPSGCGKSTLTKLVARFWDVDRGRITIGGVDIREMRTDQLMSMIAMVFQDVYLFDATIRDNIGLARPDATDEQVAEAVRRARLEPVIQRLPDGLDTRVGEGGLRLSGGERQRVAIARAFLKDAPILLLDEITSALDAENEAVLADTLAELSRGRTVVVIAHRLTTIMNADCVTVLSGRELGRPTRIVEQGTPAQLAERGGLFAELVADSRAVGRWRLGSAG